MNPRYHVMSHLGADNSNDTARSPPAVFLVRTAVRISRARWFSFLRRVFRYQNGSRSDVLSNPFNSKSWILFEFIVLIVQIVVITLVILISHAEKPIWPLRIWIAGYNLGNLLSLPLLYWRYRCLSRGGDISDTEQQRRNNTEESRSAHMMNKSRTLLELFFAIWFVMGNVWIFDTRYRSFTRAPRLHSLCISLLAWNAIGYSFPFLLFILLCCFVPLLSRAVGFNMNSASEGRGASDDQISHLPQWRYKDVEANNVQHAHQNTECCICLAKYMDKEEVRQLPCLHLFHQRCVDQWLRIISSCPLCKQDIDK
ncbi:Zinc finger RING/FYVE/PHD-type protein [Dioscorea alata]|uniref:Zinc finger RING/FYVE/PHD-type protein n=1 Tax=Dioscorea alata TaxID=55571 RepID=A0ACB7TT62_DIOAL|nr:Zinc finger RING/FYVE/PHD-type protein [Dioscorea alata]